jgi:hypothetical protein
VIEHVYIVEAALAELDSVRVDLVDARALENGVAARIEHVITAGICNQLFIDY